MTEKNPFIKPYEKRECASTPSGDMYEPTYGYEINKHGQKVLVITGETNVWEKVQEYLEETKIENILARAAAGDMTVFRPEGIYADASEVPKNLIEAQKAMQEMQNLWSQLDNDIKRKYDFDLEKFIGAAGNEEWLKDMGIIKEPIKEQPEKTETSTEKGGENNES